jgi:hypothetical protein
MSTFLINLKNHTALTASALCLMVSGAAADQVFLDDVIVDGSLCVGMDCVNGESFGFDTLRLKENNLRLNFDDTSSSASFPSNDWRITVNDSSNGGGNYFGVEDASAGRIPFRVEAGAPANALYVDDGGRIGAGTASPVVEMHVVDGDSPTIRLEQDGSSGFTPQTYDIAANESNFFIRDVTNGSRLFFRAQPGAPADSIFIASDGDIGLGTNSPGARMHVLGRALIETSDSGTEARAPVHLRGDGTARQMVWLEQAGSVNTSWVIANYESGAAEGGGNFGINQVGGGNRFLIDTSGNVYLPSLPNCATGIISDASGKLSCM